MSRNRRDLAEKGSASIYGTNADTLELNTCMAFRNLEKLNYVLNNTDWCKPLTPEEQNYFNRVRRAEERTKDCNVDLGGFRFRPRAHD